MANKLKHLWASGQAAVNAWLAIPSGFSAEVMAKCGFDTVTVDLQHGVQDYLSMVQCFQAMQAHPVTPLVRVPWNEPGIVGKVLDGGAMGVICPMVNNRSEAEALVQYAKYPPRGTRSNGPIRAAMYGEASGYQLDRQRRNPRAADDRDARGDREHGRDPRRARHCRRLCRSVRLWRFPTASTPKLDHEDPFFLDIYARLIDACGKRGLYAGIHTAGAAYAARAIGMGFRLVTIANDSGLMAMAAKAAVAQVRRDAGA